MLFLLNVPLHEDMKVCVCSLHLRMGICACIWLFSVIVQIYASFSCSLFQAQWSGKQLREAAMELQDSAQMEAQRRAAQHSRLALILPPLVLHILTLGKSFGKLVGMNESTKEIIVMTCSALIFIAFQSRVVSCQCLTAH